MQIPRSHAALLALTRLNYKILKCFYCPLNLDKYQTGCPLMAPNGAC